MPHLQSSMMTFVKFDDDACELDITFTSGKTIAIWKCPWKSTRGCSMPNPRANFQRHIKDEFNFAEVRNSTRRR